jgi:ligand-binding SRPBCC domain-containing protein
VTERIERSQLIRAPLPDVFAFFSQARNLEELTPPWLRFEVLSEEPVEMRPGTLIEYRLRLHGVPLRWVSRIEDWQPGRGFVDRQLRGPFRLWHHTHEFASEPRGTIMRDSVRYALPLGPIGTLAHMAFVRRDLSHVFDYRREQIARLLQAGAIAA